MREESAKVEKFQRFMQDQNITLKDLSEQRKIFLGWKLEYVMNKHALELNRMKLERIKHVAHQML